MTDQISSLLKYWPILMLAFAGVSGGFAFYHSMQSLSVDVSELKQMLVREERIELELKVRDNQIEQLKSGYKLQEDIIRDMQSDIRELYRVAK